MRREPKIVVQKKTKYKHYNVNYHCGTADLHRNENPMEPMGMEANIAGFLWGQKQNNVTGLPYKTVRASYRNVALFNFYGAPVATRI